MFNRTIRAVDWNWLENSDVSGPESFREMWIQFKTFSLHSVQLFHYDMVVDHVLADRYWFSKDSGHEEYVLAAMLKNNWEWSNQTIPFESLDVGKPMNSKYIIISENDRLLLFTVIV